VADRDLCQSGDFVAIDFTGFMDGEKFDNGSATDYVLELGSNSFIPGFEDALVGMKLGEDKVVDLTFPENYGAKELAGKAVRFEVTLKEIKVKVAPEWTDELAKEFGAESLAALQDKIREAMADEDEGRVRHEFQDRVRAALVEKNPLEVPEAMVEAELESMLANFSNNIRRQGMSMEMLGMTPDRFNKVYREAAVSRVKSSLLLEAVGRQEDISVSEEDLEAKITDLAERTKTDLKVVQNHFMNPEARKALQFETFEEKVVDAVAQAGKVNELSREALQQKQQAAEADKE
jgi:trigger factor